MSAARPWVRQCARRLLQWGQSLTARPARRGARRAPRPRPARPGRRRPRRTPRGRTTRRRAAPTPTRRRSTTQTPANALPASLVRFAKGVLHRHFVDFDAFLAELVLDRIARLDTQAAALRESAGTRTVADNLADALMTLFESLAVAIVALITFHDDLRARLRQARPIGVPLLTEATAMITAYLTSERGVGRIAADADVGTLALTLIGAGHLMFADRTGTPPELDAVRIMATAVLADVVREP